MPKAENKEKPSAPVARKTAGARMRKLTRKQARAKAKKEVQGRTPIIGSFRLTWQVVKTLKKFWKPLGGITLVYLILNVIFASGISDISSSVNNIKLDLNNNSLAVHPLLSGVSGFLSLVGSSGAISSAAGSTLQVTLIIIESLVIIWALRHLLADQKISIKQAYYGAPAPLIPFLLVLAFIILQLLPLSIGSFTLTAIATSLGTLSLGWEILFWIIFAGLAAWSIYMLSASIFAIYIVTLPDMRPRDALRSAKKLVKYRRWPILRRVLFLPILILAVMALFIVPLILYATSFVAPVFYILSMLAILFVHTYLYSLYRSLLA